MLSSSDSVHHPGFCRTSIRASSSCSSTCEPPQHMASMQMARARPAALYELAPRPHPLHEPSSIVGAGDVVVRPPSRRREPVSSVAVVVCVEGVDRPPTLGLSLRHLVHLLRTSSSCPGPLHICPGPLHICRGPLHICPGTLHICPGPLHICPGPLRICPGPPIAVRDGTLRSALPPARPRCERLRHRAEQSTADGRAGTSSGGTQGVLKGYSRGCARRTAGARRRQTPWQAPAERPAGPT